MKRVSLLLATLLLAGSTSAFAQGRIEPDAHVDQGDYLFKTGYYLKASEHYRLALLDDNANPWKKLKFGNALFAIGNYSYASYALRRGVADLDPGIQFKPDVASLFPSRRAFTQSMRDLKRYVTYSPRDPAGLTVLGYVLFTVRGEERRCTDMFNYLQQLDPQDPFASYFLAKLRARQTPPKVKRSANVVPPLTPRPPVEPKRVKPPEPLEMKPLPPPVVKKPKKTAIPPVKELIAPPKRQDERIGKGEWPSPVPALSE